SASFPEGVHVASERASVNATVFNKLYDRQIAVPLSLSTDRNFSVIGFEDRLVLVDPRKSSNESWDIVFPPAIEGGYIYNYSCTVSAYSQQAAGYLIEGNGQGAPLVQAAAIEGFSARQEPDGVALSFNVRNTGNADLENVSLGYASESLSLSKVIGRIPLGSSVQSDFTIPYNAIPDPSRLGGNITLGIGTQTVVNVLDIGLSPSNQTPQPSQGAQAQPAETAIIAWALLAAFTAIVLTLLMSILVRKRRRKQS
ncbi:MAG: hypothetical protein PHT59_08110, partial [Candidatus Omnitrophica bacterium]|nr:hypothetical protein [Candidatus Omnitrophota bacterium]